MPPPARCTITINATMGPRKTRKMHNPVGSTARDTVLAGGAGAPDHARGQRRQCDHDVENFSSYRHVTPRVPTVIMTIPAWTKGTFLLVLTLATGIALGVAYEQRRTLSHARFESHHMLDRPDDQLGLASEQRAAIAAIFARRQHSVDSTWHEMQPHVRATMTARHADFVSSVDRNLLPCTYCDANVRRTAVTSTRTASGNP